MKQPLKTKEDLVEKVLRQIEVDVDCRDYSATRVLLSNISLEDLIAYLPEYQHSQFKHLKNNEEDNNS